jgi:choline dehydrogenase-like flavoprotein
MFDYLIIGGGTAGCVLAARLSENPDIRVALLEAGPPDTSVLTHCPAGLALLAQSGHANWQFGTVAQAGLNGRTGYQPRGKILGGSSAINAMIYIRGQRADYDYWAAQGNPGWSYDEVLPYFKKAEHNTRGVDAFHGAAGPLSVVDLADPSPLGARFVQAGQQAGWPYNPDFNGARQDGVGTYQVTQKNGERYSAARAYLEPNLGRPNLQVLTGVHVTRILLTRKRAVGVEFCQNGEVCQLKAAREVLLCAGALQSPQILLLSGIGAHAQLLENGIATQHDLPGVGQQLHDHIDIAQVVNTAQSRDSFGLSLPGMARLARAVLTWQQQRRGPLTSNFAEAGGFIKSQPGELAADLQLHFVVAKLRNHGRTLTWGHGYSCHVTLLRPRSRGSVTLDSKDPLTPPLIDPSFLSDYDDLARLLRGFKLMRLLLAQPALAALNGRELASSAAAQTDHQIEHYIRDHADTLYHPAGSCRMGNGPLDVVNARLQVHGIDALRVVDAAIMPRLVSGNTQAAVIMIAEKAADLIKATQSG